MVEQLVQKMMKQFVRLIWVGGFFILVPGFSGSSELFASGPIADLRPTLYDRNKGEQERERRREEWRRSSRDQVSMEEESRVGESREGEIRVGEIRGRESREGEGGEQYSLYSPYYGYGSGSSINADRGQRGRASMPPPSREVHAEE